MQKVTFSNGEQNLSGVIFYPTQLREKYPGILYAHGWTGSKDRGYQYAESVAKLGFICFLFDYRGHGESGGDLNSFTIAEFLTDILVAYDYFLTIKKVDKNNISGLGNSFGGYLLTIASLQRKFRNLALRAPADYPNEDFHKLKTISSHENNDIMIWRRKNKLPSQTFALDVLSKFVGDILIMESEYDDAIPHETIENYMNAVKDKNKLTYVLLKGAPHSIMEGAFRDEIEKALVTWFKEHR